MQRRRALAPVPRVTGIQLLTARHDLVDVAPTLEEALALAEIRLSDPVHAADTYFFFDLETSRYRGWRSGPRAPRPVA